LREALEHAAALATAVNIEKAKMSPKTRRVWRYITFALP
jgi:hypothetical protein